MQHIFLLRTPKELTRYYF